MRSAVTVCDRWYGKSRGEGRQRAGNSGFRQKMCLEHDWPGGIRQAARFPSPSPAFECLHAAGHQAGGWECCRPF